LEDEWYGRGFFEREIFGVREAVSFGGADKFGAASIDHVSEIGELAAAVVEAGKTCGAFAAADSRSENDFVADLHAGDFRSNLGDFASDIATRDVRQGNRHVGKAATNPEVEMVQRTGSDANEYVSAAECGLGGLGILQHFGSPVLLKDDRFHLGFVLQRKTVGTVPGHWQVGWGFQQPIVYGNRVEFLTRQHVLLWTIDSRKRAA
jgi:hypothetical protein